MIATVVQLIALMVVFSLLESRWPASRAHKWWRRPLLVDLSSWLIHPLSISAGITLAVAVTNTLRAALPDAGPWPALLAWRARVAAFPALIQIGMAIVLADFLCYWIHRAYHRFPVLWAFHVVHHTSEKLDWLSTSRLHPVSQILNTAVVGVALLSVGLPVSAVVAANVFIGAAALSVHANVNWTFGPLHHLLVSPLFHQWHHARSDDADPHETGNFGAAFSIWDRLFGTWSLPVSRQPDHFGVADAIPLTLTGLAFYPFRVCLGFLSSGIRKFHLNASLGKGIEGKARESREKGADTYAKRQN